MTNDTIEVHVYCDDEICSNHGKEMRYDVLDKSPHPLQIKALCVGCLHRVQILVKSQ